MMIAPLYPDATPRARQNETLDAMVWRLTGKASGAIEAVLLANPGLADIGATLPEGHAVILPALPATDTRELELVSLWD